MKKFEEWFEKYIKTSDIPGYKPMMEDAFKAGLRVSAEMCKTRADKYCYEEKSPEKASVAYGLQVMIYEDFLEDR